MAFLQAPLQLIPIELNHNINKIPFSRRKVKGLNRFKWHPCILYVTVEPFQCCVVLVTKIVPYINIWNFVLPMIRQRAMMFQASLAKLTDTNKKPLADWCIRVVHMDKTYQYYTTKQAKSALCIFCRTYA